MFSLADPIRSRLQALSALSGWPVRLAIETVSRKAVPAVDIAAALAQPLGNSRSGTQMEVQWAVSLIVPQAAGATAQINAAFGAVLGALHGWMPGEQGGRRWDALRLVSASPPPETEAREPGLIEYQLVFSTSARFDGQP